MKETAAKATPKPAVVSLAQLLTEQPASPPPGWIEPGLLPPAGILFVGGEPKVGKSLLVANLALALAAGKDRAGFSIPAARRVLVCQFELPTPQFVGRLAAMRRAVGAAADQNLLVDTRAGGHLLSAPQGGSNSAAFSQLRQAFSRSRASSYQPMSRCSSGGLFAPNILRILMERFSIAVTPLNCCYASRASKENRQAEENQKGK